MCYSLCPKILALLVCYFVNFRGEDELAIGSLPCTGWSESPVAVEFPGDVVLHGDCCHTHPGISGGGGRKQSRGIHRGRPHLLFCLQFCLWMGVSFHQLNICFASHKWPEKYCQGFQSSVFNSF